MTNLTLFHIAELIVDVRSRKVVYNNKMFPSSSASFCRLSFGLFEPECN